MDSEFRLEIEGGKVRNHDLAAAELLLLYVPAGTVKVVLHDEEYVMQAQDIIAVNNGSGFTYETEGADTFIARIGIPSCLFADEQQEQAYIVVCNSCAAPDVDYSDLVIILKMILQHYLRSRSIDYFIEGYMYLLVHSLKEQYLMTFSDAGYRNQATAASERMALITSYVDSHYSQDISLNELAGQLHLALSYLSRFVRKSFGMTFTDYVNLVRLRHVVEDFARSSRSVTRIAMENGFSNISTFNRAFRQLYGEAPSEYRKRILEDHERENMIFPAASEEEQAPDYELLKEILGDQEELPASPVVHGTRLNLRETVQIDRTKEINRPWGKILNAGRLSDLKDTRMRTEIIRSSKELKTEYVRIWNVLSDDVNLGTYRGSSVSDYDFGVFDSCIDFLLQNGVKPYLHFGYNLPYGQNAAGPVEDRINSNRIGKLFHFRSYEELCGTLKALLKHLLYRYGAETVRSFRFSLWYPNLYYKLPDFMMDEDRGAFAVHIYHTIRKIIPEALIGAADFSLLFEKDRIFERIQYMDRHGVKPDFVTCVSFPYRFVLQDGAVVRAWQIQAGFLKSELESLKSVLQQTTWSLLPVWVSEFNVTLEQRNSLNDIRFKGAYIIKNMVDICEYVQGAGYYMLSDIYSEAADTNGVFFGGCGMVNKNGIRKPAYYALQFLSRIEKYKVASSSKYILTTDRQGRYSLIIHNFADPGFSVLARPELSIRKEDFGQLFEDTPSMDFNLTITGLEPGTYVFRRLEVNAENGDIIAWLINSRMEERFEGSDIDYIQHRCVPDMHIWSDQVGDDGAVMISSSLEPNDFELIEFSVYRD